MATTMICTNVSGQLLFQRRRRFSPVAHPIVSQFPSEQTYDPMGSLNLIRINKRTIVNWT